MRTVRLNEVGLRRIVRKIVAEQSRRMTIYDELARDILNNDQTGIQFGIADVSRSMKDDETAASVVQKLVAGGLDQATARSFVEKNFSFLVDEEAAFANSPYAVFQSAMYKNKGDERQAAQEIRDLVKSSPNKHEEVMRGLVKAGIDPDDAESYAYEILNRKY